MIDWVSIVRHSRRRFSNYMYAVPSKVRKRRRHQQKRFDSSVGSRSSVGDALAATSGTSGTSSSRT
ncbi:Uncharacterized protein GBIM_22209, partial [Gryllus bimaculatus]